MINLKAYQSFENGLVANRNEFEKCFAEKLSALVRGQLNKVFSDEFGNIKMRYSGKIQNSLRANEFTLDNVDSYHLRITNNDGDSIILFDEELTEKFLKFKETVKTYLESTAKKKLASVLKTEVKEV